MGRTALYRDPVPFRSARAEIYLDAGVLTLALPEGRPRRYSLDGSIATCIDGFQIARIDLRAERRFVRMLVLEREHDRLVIITPPEHGAVAPNVVRVPEAPSDAVVVDVPAWNTLADWLTGGARLAGCSIADLARLAELATSAFALVIGEVAAQRALEHTSATRGPLRSSFDLESALESALHPLAATARRSPRAGEAMAAALAHAAGTPLPRRRAEPRLGLRQLVWWLFERLTRRSNPRSKLATRVIAR